MINLGRYNLELYFSPNDLALHERMGLVTDIKYSYTWGVPRKIRLPCFVFLIFFEISSVLALPGSTSHTMDVYKYVEMPRLRLKAHGFVLYMVVSE